MNKIHFFAQIGIKNLKKNRVGNHQKTFQKLKGLIEQRLLLTFDIFVQDKV